MEQMNLTRDPNVLVDVILPTGAWEIMVDVYKKMGIPLGKLNAGVNENDITFSRRADGSFHKSSPVMIKTPSDAINIQDTYNFERCSLPDRRKPELVKGWMDDMDATSKMDLSTEWHGRHSKNLLRAGQGRRNVRHYASRPDTTTWWTPHTAVAIAAANWVTNCKTQNERPQLPLWLPRHPVSSKNPSRWRLVKTHGPNTSNGFPESGKRSLKGRNPTDHLRGCAGIFPGRESGGVGKDGSWYHRRAWSVK
jgi:hypothetical protein